MWAALFRARLANRTMFRPLVKAHDDFGERAGRGPSPPPRMRCRAGRGPTKSESHGPGGARATLPILGQIPGRSARSDRPLPGRLGMMATGRSPLLGREAELGCLAEAL